MENDRQTKFEELRRKLQGEQSAQPAAQESLSKFEELRRRLQGGQAAAPAEQAAPPAAAQQPDAPQLAPEELQNRLLLAEVKISEDKASAQLRLFRPVDGQPPLSMAELMDILTRRGVSKGVDEDLLARLAMRPDYETVHTAAVGADPVHGENGRIEYHFDAERKLLPVQDEHGNVDYRNLGYVVNVEENELLCDVVLPTQGVPGYDVTGRSRPARNGASVASPMGANTYLSEDGTKLFAKCAGAAVLNAGKVCVQTSLEIPFVDGTTGNIEFRHGSVLVTGDVKDGFCITAGGDISIKGNVEGAKLTAGGSVTLARGMNGLGFGEITAGTDVNAFFLENIVIHAEGSVTADVILNCRVFSRGDVLLKGQNANLLGGECVTYGSVKAKDIGNDLDVVTKIELIGKRTLIKEREELNGRVEENAEEMRKLYKTAEAGVRPGALIPEKRAAEKAIAELQQLKDVTEGMQARLDELQAQLDAMGELGVVMAWGTMYTNTRMNFDTIKYNNSFQRPMCCAYCDGGEVAFRAGQKF